MNYRRSIIFIESLLRHGIKLGLDRVQRLLTALDSPHNKFPSILIAGTNGKGSTAAFVSAILTQAGFKAGLYTSPHLLEYTERFRINERDISPKSFSAAATKVRKALKSVPGLRITEFEFLTAMAFLIFARAKVDIAVLEVGMGGRFDATNVLTPLCSVVTNVELDHTEFLGKTVQKIAFEKAGIIKAGVPVVTAERKREALRVIGKICKDRVAKLEIISNDELRMTNYGIALKGEHQKTNAALALKIISVIKKKGYKVPESALKSGLKTVRWSGRFEVASKKPLVILDGGHNPAGIAVLVKELTRIKGNKKIIIILGMQANKDIKGAVKKLSGVADSFILTKSKHLQAAQPQKLAKYVKVPYRIIPDFSRAYRTALKNADIIVVCGSLFLVAEAKKIR